MIRKKYKNKFLLCYPILEKGIYGILKKIEKIDDKLIDAYEIRLDTLKYIDDSDNKVKEILNAINVVKKCYKKKKIIATIRTCKEGGKSNIDKKKYAFYIEEICKNSLADYVDIENDTLKDVGNTFYKHYKKKIILSKHIFDKKFSKEKCKTTIEKMLKKECSILKMAVAVYNEKDLYEYMDLAKSYALRLEKRGTKCIFIAMGDMGKVSRIFPEYTKTQVVFLNAYKKRELGQFSLKEYIYYRNIIFAKNKNNILW